MKRNALLVVLIGAFIAVMGCRSTLTDPEPISSSEQQTGVTTEPEAISTTAQKWDPSGWQLAIIREAKYALSRRTNGTSAVILNWNGRYYGSDWDYVSSDRRARDRMKRRYRSASGVYDYGYERIAGRKVGHGGYCKFFADLVQWRATGGNKGYLPRNVEARGSIDHVGPGDIIQIPRYYGHTAIVIRVLERDSRGRVTKVDVVDSNYIGGNGDFMIARHPISGSELRRYRTYH